MGKRILQLMGSLNVGGAENLVFDLLSYNNLLPQEEKIDFYLVYSVESAGSRLDMFKSLLGEDRISLINGGKGLGKTIKFVYNLRRFIKKNRIDVVHCHNNADAYLALIACGYGGRKSRIKLSRRPHLQKIQKIEGKKSHDILPDVILTVHGLNLDFNFMNRRLFLKPVACNGAEPHDNRNFIQSFIGKFYKSYSDAHLLEHAWITFVSLAAKDYYVEKYSPVEGGANENESEKICGCLKNGKVIHNSINPDKVLNALPYKDLFKELGADSVEGERPFTMGMVGNFNTEARLQKMICEALCKLPETLPFRFVFVGGKSKANPEYMENCIKICKENNIYDKVIFAGTRHDVPRILKSLDCYIYGSSADTFGLSVVEAVIAGLPVICSDIPSMREVLLNGNLGSVVFNSPDAFAYTIQKAYDTFVENRNMCCTDEKGAACLACQAADRQELAMMAYSVENTFKSYYYKLIK